MTLRYFSAYTAQLHPATSGGTTAPRSYSEPTATQVVEPQLQAVSPLPEERRDITEWLRTPAAHAYEGRWVLLDDALNVLDSDHSPTILLKRNPEHATPLIVFVDPLNSQLAV